MKKLLLILIATITLTSCTQQKIGFVNTEKLIKEYKETINLESEMKIKSEKIQKELPGLISDFQTKVAAYQKKAARLSALERQQQEQVLGVEQQKIQQLQQQIQTEGQAAMVKIAETTNTFIKEYGKKNGYQLILGTVDLNGAVMYGDEKTDLTEIILTALNTEFDSNNKKEETSKSSNAVKKETKTEAVKEVETKK